MKLSELFTKYGSDKCTTHSYGLIYDQYFPTFGNHPLDILEVGVQYGGSLMAWKDFFPLAKVTGVDLEDVRKWKRPDVEMVISDILDYKPDREFDIIIEDGGHQPESQAWAGFTLVKYLKPNGILIIEDIHTDYLLGILDKINKELEEKCIVNVIDLRRIKNVKTDCLIVIVKQT